METSFGKISDKKLQRWIKDIVDDFTFERGAQTHTVLMYLEDTKRVRKQGSKITEKNFVAFDEEFPEEAAKRLVDIFYSASPSPDEYRDIRKKEKIFNKEAAEKYPVLIEKYKKLGRAFYEGRVLENTPGTPASDLEIAEYSQFVREKILEESWMPKDLDSKNKRVLSLREIKAPLKKRLEENRSLDNDARLKLFAERENDIHRISGEDFGEILDSKYNKQIKGGNLFGATFALLGSWHLINQDTSGLPLPPEAKILLASAELGMGAYLMIGPENIKKGVERTAKKIENGLGWVTKELNKIAHHTDKARDGI